MISKQKLRWTNDPLKIVSSTAGSVALGGYAAGLSAVGVIWPSMWIGVAVSIFFRYNFPKFDVDYEVFKGPGTLCLQQSRRHAKSAEV